MRVTLKGIAAFFDRAAPFRVADVANDASLFPQSNEENVYRQHRRRRDPDVELKTVRKCRR